MKLASFFFLSIFCTQSANSAEPVNIPVQNASFEDPGIAMKSHEEQTSQVGPEGWTWVNALRAAVDNPGDANIFDGGQEGQLPAPATGMQFAYLNVPPKKGRTADLLYAGKSLGKFVAGTKYVLTVSVGNRKGFVSPTYWISLSGGKDILLGPSASGTAPEGSFVDLSVTYTATSEDDNRVIGIQLKAENNTDKFCPSSFDNVRLRAIGPIVSPKTFSPTLEIPKFPQLQDIKELQDKLDEQQK